MFTIRQTTHSPLLEFICFPYAYNSDWWGHLELSVWQARICWGHQAHTFRMGAMKYISSICYFLHSNALLRHCLFVKSYIHIQPSECWYWNIPGQFDRYHGYWWPGSCYWQPWYWLCIRIYTGLILGLRPANERRRYKVTPSLVGWGQK